MKKIFNTPWSIAIVGSVSFLLYFLLTYPTGLVITDEYFYYHQAYALSQFQWLLDVPDFSSCLANNISVLPGGYPIGTAFFQAIFIFLFGKNVVFLTSCFWMLGSYLLFFFNWVKNGFNPILSLLLLCSPVCLFYSKTLMSDIPSLFFGVLAFNFYLKFKRKESINTLLFGLLTSLSICFRETNILLFLPLLIYLRKSRRLYFGLILGLSFRFISSYILFGSPFFIKDSGCGFSGTLFLEHSLIFLSFVLVCIPGCILFIGRIRENLRRNIPMSLVVFLFFLCYSIYDYDSLGTSGSVQGLLLYLRFYIPVLPFLIYLGTVFDSELRNKWWFNPLKLSHGILIGFFVFVLNNNLTSLYADQLEAKEFVINHLDESSIFREYDLNQFKLINYYHFEELPRSIMYNRKELLCYLDENKRVLILSDSDFEPSIAYRDLMKNKNLGIDSMLRNKSYSIFLIKGNE